MDQKSVRFIIHGRVQGVGFRAFTAECAREVGVMGWVRNRTDGTVEAVVTGTESQVNAMLAYVKKGPNAARVDEVHVDEAQPESCVFTQKPTV